MPPTKQTKKRARETRDGGDSDAPPSKRSISSADVQANQNSADLSSSSRATKRTEITIQPPPFEITFPRDPKTSLPSVNSDGTRLIPPNSNFPGIMPGMDPLMMPMVHDLFDFPPIDQSTPFAAFPFLPEGFLDSNPGDIPTAVITEGDERDSYLDDLLEGMDLADLDLLEDGASSVPNLSNASTSQSSTNNVSPPSGSSEKSPLNEAAPGPMWIPNTLFSCDDNGIFGFDAHVNRNDVVMAEAPTENQPPSLPPALESIEEPKPTNKSNALLIESWQKWTTSPFPTSYIDPAKERLLLQQNSQAFAQFAQHRAILYHSYLKSRNEIATSTSMHEDTQERRSLLSQIEIDAKIQEKACFNSYWETTFGPIASNSNSKNSRKKDTGGRRTKRPKFNEYDVRVLEDWFETNRANPYPTSKQQQRMAEITGLSKYQVSRWFCNARIRRARD